MPVFNEAQTLRKCIDRILSVTLEHSWSTHIILIDDGSDVATQSAAGTIADHCKESLTLLHHRVNRGKGAALQTGFAHAASISKDRHDAIIIQDADLEYDPQDFNTLLRAMKTHSANCAVFGNRWHAGSVQRGLQGWMHMRCNRLLTAASNLATGLRVTDMECCYKLLPIDALRTIMPSLTEQRFGIEPQIAAALATAGIRVIEVPVAYAPRSLHEGKKIGPIDGLRALWVIFRAR